MGISNLFDQFYNAGVKQADRGKTEIP